MRAALAVLLLLAPLALPARAQTCKKAPPPFLADLFPESVSGLPLEFSSAPGVGCMALYRPEEEAARRTRMWVSVVMENEPDPAVGETAESVSKRFGRDPATRMLSVGDWPAAFTVRSIGDEFLTVRGSVRIKLLVKNGDQGEGSITLATTFLERILANVPCG